MLTRVQTTQPLSSAPGTWPRQLSPTQRPDLSSAEELANELRRSIRGEVRFDDGSRALYATDGSNYREIPVGVVVPKDVDDVVATVAACRRYKAPVLNRGGGTSLAGQCCNTAVVIDMSKYLHRVTSIDPERKIVTVEPGCVLDTLRHEASRYGLTFGPDPATHTHCTLGGMIGNNACGVHAQMAGRTADNIEELEILTYDGLRMRVGRTSDSEMDQIIRSGGRRGQIYSRLRDLRDRYAGLIRERYPKIPRRVSGYNLDFLLPEHGFHVARALVGSESTCVTVLEAVCNLVPQPAETSVVVLGYPDVYEAADHISAVVAAQPVGCEGFDGHLIGYYRRKGQYLRELSLLPEGNGWLIAEFGGDSVEEARERARALMHKLENSRTPPEMRLFDEHEEQEMIWTLREGGLGATSFVPGERDTWTGWEDSAVAPEALGGYLRDLRELFKKHNYDPSLYGHFGQGCVHTRVQFDLVTKEGIGNWKAFLNDATDLVIKYGGSLSGEHGDGQSRGQYLEKMFGPELLNAFREFKSIWDPDGRMNPGKVVDPYPVDRGLRLGLNYDPPQPRTHFHYPDDNFSFARATLRCVGVGKCRRDSGGTMCPSYMVTRDERHSTRGRAHLLFEMMQGNPLDGGWRDERVREALDLCLSCKGCKGDCPVGVDVATYKAEFLSHYYHGRLRPRHAFASGLIFWWARLASLAPSVANFFTQTPVFSHVAKAVAGYSQKRELPRFAPQRFRDWFSNRRIRNEGKPAVMLWPDTFNNFFTPEVLKAAVEVLESAGWQVRIPSRWGCCGRPLYDYGMLDMARSRLLDTLEVLRPAIREGLPVVGLEPSCVSVFRDEMRNLLHGNTDVERLAPNTFMLSEFLDKEAGDYKAPKLRRKAMVQRHCHHRSVLDFASEHTLMRRMELDSELLDSGCCGMAGAFGYEAEHYDVGKQCGERVLLPAVRKADPETLIIADGFSCREMIRQETGREAIHFAQTLQMALREGPAGPAARPAERDYPTVRRTGGGSISLAGGVAVVGALAGAAYLYRSKTGRRTNADNTVANGQSQNVGHHLRSRG